MSKEYPVDSKVFFWSLGANIWGRYLRISENGAGCAPSSLCAFESGPCWHEISFLHSTVLLLCKPGPQE